MGVVTREFQKLKKMADDAIGQCSDDNFFAAPSPLDNNVAVIVKHMGGNLVSRWTDFLTSDGEKPNRNRDQEFELGPDDTRTAVTALWERGWTELFQALRPLTDSDLNRPVRIRGEELSVLQAINRQLTHYSYHVGQIVYLAKHHAGSSWKTLSIPRGASADFNRNPDRYMR